MFSDNDMLKEAVLTNDSHGGAPADNTFGVAWDEFEKVLAGYLAAMVDAESNDHLIVELAGDDQTGTAPYVQFAGFGGDMLRAEASSNNYLGPVFRIGEVDEEFLTHLGFRIDETDGIASGNWYVERPTAEAATVAQLAVTVLQEVFGIAHPHLLTYQAWGPAAARSESLGLLPSSDVPIEVTPETGSRRRKAAYRPKNRDKLIALVGRVLADKYDGEPEPDADGDYQVSHMGQAVWVRVRDDQPAVEIMARVTHDVRSRRGTAVEIGILNRDNLWVKWELRERAVWQKLVFPGFPFAPDHLDGMLDVFMDAMTQTRDDLVLRVGGRTA